MHLKFMTLGLCAHDPLPRMPMSPIFHAKLEHLLNEALSHFVIIFFFMAQLHFAHTFITIT